MYPYDGITTDALFLLTQNRIENSKAFYEAHKGEINAGVIRPMRQLAEIIGSELAKWDEHMQVIPTRMVSRIRRDTRFTKDKSLYRENVWMSFERPKKEWMEYPGLWFEVSPGGMSYGIGFYANTPGFMAFFREQMCSHPQEFLKAARRALQSGALLDGEDYKKKKPGDYPQELSAYYNKKQLYFIKSVSGHEALEDERIIRDLLRDYGEFREMYRFLASVSDAYLAKEKELQNG